MSNILILGSAIKSAAYTIKQLSKYGLRTVVYDWEPSPLRYSKYVNEYVLAESPYRDIDRFVNQLLIYLQTQNINCVLPINDQALEICKANYDTISKYTKLIGVNNSFAHEYAHNKYELLKLAEQVQLKAPKTVLLSSLEEFNLKTAEITYPCIVKPVSSALLKDNRLYMFSVKKIETYNELVDYVRENINNVNIMIQEIIQGFGMGYNIIAQDGKILNEYIHRRIFEHDGESSYRESLPAQKYNIREKVHQLINKTNWSGVAMVEFKINEDEAYIMEMNGRFWGSIEVGIRSGLNYPVLLYQLQYLNEKIPVGIEINHVRVRNLQEELIYFSKNILVNGNFTHFFRWIGTFSNAFRKNEFIEDNIFDDPKFVLSSYFSFFKRFIKKRVIKWKIRSISISRHRTVVPLNKKSSIAFVCTGNICRSPFAEYYAKKINPAHNYSSFGTVNAENRLSPVNAVSAAINFDVDLSGFLSKAFKKEFLQKIDYFFVMDKKNFWDLTNLGVSENKIFFMGNEEIRDPYSKPLEDFELAYKEIINNMVKVLPVG